MSPVFKGSKRIAAPSAQDLAGQALALTEAVAAGGRELEPAAVDLAENLADKVSERTALTGDHTVVALAGATGSGKSSLFNAIVGSTVSRIGARRPTTSQPTAAVWGRSPATEVLDWLSVSARHHAGRGDDGPQHGSLDGLVLLDLPDFDSRVESHRREATRMLELVDVFVWVTDPQKYADARLHHDYVRALSTHDAVTIVVLNQIDRLSAEDAARCRDDLKRLLAADGLPDAQVITTSATTGQGVPELRQRLANAVAGATASRARLAADIVAAAGRLRSGVGTAEAKVAADPDGELVEALSRAAGVPVVVKAVADDYRREAASIGGWLFTRWISAFKADPLARLRLDKAAVPIEGLQEADVRAVLGRSSIPPASPAARAAVALATQRLADRAAEGLPPRWVNAVHEAATPDTSSLSDTLDQAVLGTRLRDRNPAWWNLMAGLQWVFGIAAIVGGLWLLVMAVMGWLQLPPLPTPTIWELPIPTVLFAGGLILGGLLAVSARVMAGWGARRRASVVDRRLREVIAGVAKEQIVGPVTSVLARHRRTRELLDRAAKAG